MKNLGIIFLVVFMECWIFFFLKVFGNKLVRNIEYGIYLFGYYF